MKGLRLVTDRNNILLHLTSRLEEKRELLCRSNIWVNNFECKKLVQTSKLKLCGLFMSKMQGYVNIYTYVDQISVITEWMLIA